ncbi:MAG: hypothetical protein H6732_08180 [Alphaproteobacteria bacterium]|nr:hypothetical protein [Alphaproteobacteria bacterium]
MPSVRALILLTALLGACAKPPDSLARIAEKQDYGQTPRLPPPESNSYATAVESPRDPVVAALVRGKHYEGALAGAAAGIALSIAEGEGSLNRWELREALWRAGFAYPVHDARRWDTVLNGAPPRELIAWLEQLAPDEPMGLVRARGRDRDHWIGMRARPEVDLGVLPRLTEVGTPLQLPPVPGATWQVADGGGRVTQGSLDQGARVLLATAGEWVFVVRRDDHDLARFVLYVGIDGSPDPILRLKGPVPAVTAAGDADLLARKVLEHVRTAYAREPWKASPVLDTAVSRFLERRQQGAAAVLSGLGFPPAEVEVWACDDVTVQNCIDWWLWDPRRRDLLVSDAVDGFGLQTVLDGEGVHLTLMLVDTDIAP